MPLIRTRLAKTPSSALEEIDYKKIRLNYFGIQQDIIFPFKFINKW